MVSNNSERPETSSSERIIITQQDILAQESAYRNTTYENNETPVLANRGSKYLTGTAVASIPLGIIFFAVGSVVSTIVALGVAIVALIVFWGVMLAIYHLSASGSVGSTPSQLSLNAGQPTNTPQLSGGSTIIITAADVLSSNTPTMTGTNASSRTSTISQPVSSVTNPPASSRSGTVTGGNRNVDQAICPYCGDSIGARASLVCGLCKTSHHKECWTVNKGCTTLGCPNNTAH
jgi:hypothetical protein